MRKLPAILATLSLSAAALTGCSVVTVSGDSCERVVSDGRIAELTTVEGALGEIPEFSVKAPVRVSETSQTDLIVGEGSPLAADNQGAVIEVSLFHGETGALVGATHMTGQPAPVRDITYWKNFIPGIGTALHCATEGTRMLIALSPEGLGESARQGLNVGAGESLVAVVDVTRTFLAHAEGRRQFNAGHGLPSVVRAPDGRPGVIIPGVDAPTELVTQVLIKGAGEPVSNEAGFYAHYTGLTWAEREVFATSWDDAPVPFSLDNLVDGVRVALEGQTVGSQVLVVVPPELGYGDQDQRDIPAGSTLVFVFDILGIDAAPAQ